MTDKQQSAARFYYLRLLCILGIFPSGCGPALGQGKYLSAMGRRDLC